jgi:carbonic anhydrase
MSPLTRLFDNNAAWSAQMVERDARFFERLQRQQAPEYLWIGCSDSRVPANEIVGLVVGRQLAVHGWIYGLGDGRLHDVGFVATQLQDVERAYGQAVTQMSARPSA